MAPATSHPIAGLRHRHSIIESPEQIVFLGCRNAAKGLENLSVSYPDFEDWRAEARSFQGLEGFTTGTMNDSDGEGAPERMNGNWVTAGAFRLIGRRPLLGRDFLPEEDRPGAMPVVILGYDVWQAATEAIRTSWAGRSG